MIITKLIGGLGNQMFQYAAGLGLAQKNGSAIRVDMTELRRYRLHQGYQLPSIFTGHFEQATKVELFKLLRFRMNKVVKGGLKVDPDWTPNPSSRVIRQNTHNYWSDFQNLNGEFYLAGYWQSSKYFSNARETVRDAFRFRPNTNAENQKLMAQMQHQNSVCIHIRRGDYVSNAKALKFHGICEKPYYDKAVKIMQDRLADPKFYIFSDDPVLARTQYPDTDRFTVIDINRGADSYRDMQLMTHCKHHIIANSSFSWWGAWLATHPEQIVIAPSVWFAGSDEPIKDIYEPNWHQI